MTCQDYYCEQNNAEATTYCPVCQCHFCEVCTLRHDKKYPDCVAKSILIIKNSKLDTKGLAADFARVMADHEVE